MVAKWCKVVVLYASTFSAAQNGGRKTQIGEREAGFDFGVACGCGGCVGCDRGAPVSQRAG
eukprot:1188484-Prorocentrum_minimum.AAC.3